MNEDEYPVPRQYSLVQFDPEMIAWYKKNAPKAKVGDVPWREVCIFLGEIPNMPGHCVVVGRESGKMFAGWHTENYIELTDDDFDNYYDLIKKLAK